MVAGHDADVDAGRRQALDTLRELALMRRRGVARLVDIAGEDDQIDLGFDRAIDGLVKRLEEVVQALIQTRFGIDPAVVLHADMRIGEVRDLHASVPKISS